MNYLWGVFDIIIYIYIYREREREREREVQVTSGVTLQSYTFFKSLDLSKSNGKKKTLINANIFIRISLIISHLLYFISISKSQKSVYLTLSLYTFLSLSLSPLPLFNLHGQIAGSRNNNNNKIQREYYPSVSLDSPLVYPNELQIAKKSIQTMNSSFILPSTNTSTD